MANPRDAELSIIGHDRTGNATRSAGNNFDQLKRKVDDTEKSNQRFRKSTEQVSVSVLGLTFRLGAMASKVVGGGGPVVAIAGLTAGLWALRAASAGVAVGVVGVLGAGLLAIGIKAALANKQVRDEFKKTGDHIKERAKDFGKPFEPVLISIAQNVRKTFDFFAPALQSAMDKLAPHLQSFQANFFNAIKPLKPVIGQVADQFGVMLDKIGPRLPALFKAIGNAVSEMVSILERNPQFIDNMVKGFTGIINAAPGVINFFITAGRYVDMFITGIKRVLTEFKIFSTQFAIGFLRTIGVIVGAAAKIPGPWQDSMKKAETAVRGAVNRAQADLNSLKVDRAKNEISTLQNKINSLQGKKVVTEADRVQIEQSKARIRELQGQINSLQGKTVTVTSRYVQINIERNYKGNPVTGAPGRFSAGPSWSPIMGGGSYRTQAPTPVVNVGSPNVNVSSYIDVDGFRSLIRSEVRSAISENNRVTKVGRR